MAKVGNALKFSGVAIFGFCVGIIIYILVVMLLVGILGDGGGFILIFALIGFPFIAIPLGITFANIAIAREKTKIDKTSSPAQQKSNTIFFVIFLIVSVILILLVRFSAINWIRHVVK